MELLQVDMGIYHFKMHFKLVSYQMSYCYLGSESKTNMIKLYFEFFIANYFKPFNKKRPCCYNRYWLGSSSCFLPGSLLLREFVTFPQWEFGWQLTSINLGVWRKSKNLFFFKKNYILRCVMVQNIYFNTFFVKIDPGVPLKPPKSGFFNVGVKLRK